MNTKKTILLVLWFAGSSMMLPAQWLNHDFRLTNEDEFSHSLFRSKPKSVRGQPLLLPEKGYIYSYNMDNPSHEVNYFYDEKGVLKTEISTSLIPNSTFATVRIDYNQTLTMDGIDMPDTATYYYDTDMTKPSRRQYWNWRLYDVHPVDSFYFEEIVQRWDTPDKGWNNYDNLYSGFIDTVSWELNRIKQYKGDGADGWVMTEDYTDSLLYDDRGFITGMIRRMNDIYHKRIYTLNEDGSVRIDSLYDYDAEGEPVLRRIDEYEWQEWNGYEDMFLMSVTGGDGTFALFPWMTQRNKRAIWDIYMINNEGEKSFDNRRKKYWDVGPFDSNIDTTFVSLDGSLDNLYTRKVIENLYDSYGNYIKYSAITYNPPDATGHQTLFTVWIDDYYHHYTDYGEHGIGCDTMMYWMEDWKPGQDTYEMKFWSATIITQFVGFTGIAEVDNSQKMLSIFPNPVSGVVTIAAASEMQQLSIYDITGKLVESRSPAGERVVFDTGALPQGVYLVRALLRDGGVRTGKVVKK